jgi:hypothetical protein
MNRKSDGLDYLAALKLFMPYYDKLKKIYLAYLDNEFEANDALDDLDPFLATTYYLRSKGYNLYQIKSLSEELIKSSQNLSFTHYNFSKYIEIENKFGIYLPYDFDFTWSLDEIYLYLLHIFDGFDYITIENNIINGSIYKILECFLIRI